MEIKRRCYTLINGPYHDQKLYLTEPHTLTFRLRNYVGRYRMSYMDSHTLVWEAL